MEGATLATAGGQEHRNMANKVQFASAGEGTVIGAGGAGTWLA